MIKVTSEILSLLAGEIASLAQKLDGPPDLTWLYETISRQYDDQLTQSEIESLIKIVREEHLNFQTKITGVVSKKLNYEKLTIEKLGMFSNPDPEKCYFWNRYSKKYKCSKNFYSNFINISNKFLFVFYFFYKL